MTRAGNRVETRRKLIEAAAEVYATQAWEGTSVALVARRAGFTTGALYGIFTGKLDLLTTVLEERADGIADGLRDAVAQATTFTGKVHALHGWYAGRLERDRIGGRLTFDLVRRAYDEPDVRARLKAVYDRVRARAAEALAHDFNREGDPTNGHRALKLPMESQHLASILIALFDGLLIQQIVDQDQAVLDAAFDLLGRVQLK